MANAKHWQKSSFQIWMSRQWNSKSNTEERRHGLGSLWPSVLYRLEKTECIISRNLLLLPHDTSGGGGPSRYDEAPFSHWERMFAYYFIIPPGPQENKPISCHCDRIKMEPSYFCNTMQAGRERGTVSERAADRPSSTYQADELWSGLFLAQRL